METKTELRQACRRLRAALPADARAARSRALMGQLALHQRVMQAPTVLAYVAVGSEVETRALLTDCWQRQQPVALPVVLADGHLEMRWVANAQGLIASLHGIPAPDPKRCPLWRPAAGDVMLVPGVAFTVDGLRLGQGGGYYDRFSARHPALWRIGVAFVEQVVAALPVEAHDVRMNEVVAG